MINIIIPVLYLIFASTSLYLHKQTSHPNDYEDRAEYIAVSTTAFIAGPFILVTSVISTITEITIRSIISGD